MKDLIKYNIPIYGGELWVMFGADIVKIGKEIGMDFSPDTNDCNGVAFTKSDDKGPGIYCVILKPNKVRPDIIAHEAVHIVNYLFSERGVGISLKDDEHYAYMIGWIVQQIVYAAKDRRKTFSIRINGPHDQQLNYGKKVKPWP